MNEPEIVVDFAAAEEVVPLTEAIQDEVDPLNSGFLWYTPPMDSNKENSGYEWCIAGHDMQVLTTILPPGEQVVTEIGTFLFGSPDIKTDVELTLCSRRGCGDGWNRIFGGESCVKVLLVNESSSNGYVGLTPNYVAKVVPLKVRLSE